MSPGTRLRPRSAHAVPCSFKSVTLEETMAALIRFLVLVLIVYSSRTVHSAPAESTRSSRSIRNLTASLGQEIEIPCDLKASADSVKLIWLNWNRKTILTVNHVLVTQDERFSSSEKDGSWSLVIERVQRDDAGTYRCQIDTGPNLASDVNLLVKGCEGDDFACSDDRCITRRQRCDGLNHCVDGEDEENCAPEDCKGVNIYCGNGKCIPIQYFCDENDDCGNGFDEANCSRPLPVDCPAGEFPCGDGECIALTKHCDGRKDCENGADEHPETCQGPSSPPTATATRGNATGCNDSFTGCGDGQCVPASWWCDGEVDCDNAADEKRCDAKDCQLETTYCGDGRCVKGGRCDGKEDCDKGYDEKDCSPSDCFPGARYCGNGRCAASYMICDGIDQCGNGADEKFCDRQTLSTTLGPTSPAATTSPDPGGVSGRAKYQDSSSISKVLEELMRGIAHSANQSLAVQRTIAATVWRTCKMEFDRLDGLPTTSDHVHRTLYGSFPCKNPYMTTNHNLADSVPFKRRCDGVEDCSNGRDEKGCSLEEVCGAEPMVT